MSLIKIDKDLITGLTAPMTKIIDVVSKAFGTLYEPTKIERKAKALAKAKIYEKIGELVSNDLERRGLQYHIKQLGRKQLNIDKIINKTLRQQMAIDNSKEGNKISLEETPHFENKENTNSEPSLDWIMDFFDLCQNSSDDELQEIWASLLRSEITKPGTVSRRLMHTLKIMSKKEALVFQNLSSCYAQITAGSEKLYESDSSEEPMFYFGTITCVGDVELYENEFENNIYGFDYYTTTLLEEIGLINRIQFFSSDNYARIIEFDEESKIKLKNAEFEVCNLTGLGLELFNISNNDLNTLYKKTVLDELTKSKMIEPSTEK